MSPRGAGYLFGQDVVQQVEFTTIILFTTQLYNIMFLVQSYQ